MARLRRSRTTGVRDRHRTPGSLPQGARTTLRREDRLARRVADNVTSAHSTSDAHVGPRALRRNELERFVDLSSDLLSIGDTEYLKWVNPAYERAPGYTSQELLSRPFLDFIHPADRPH